ncbi:MAG: DUF6637 family protein [Stomatobaculum sp.]
MAERKRKPQRMNFLLDVLHLLIGAIVVLLSVMAFLAPEEHPAFFPLIFLLSALLSLVNGAVRLRAAGKNGKMKLFGIAGIVIGLLLVILSVASALVML